VPDWLLFLLYVLIWTPPLVLIHELGHAGAALVFTDGDVSIGLKRAGLDGGWASYDAGQLRAARDEAWICAAGPGVSLLCAAVLWAASLAGDGGWVVAFVKGGAIVATFQFVTCALPVRYGNGFGWGESDGRAIWRILTGTPPAIDIELRQPFEEPVAGTRPVFVVLLALIAVLTLLLDPMLAVELVGLFVAVIVWTRVL
jgi:hypothetical protein